MIVRVLQETRDYSLGKNFHAGEEFETTDYAGEKLIAAGLAEKVEKSVSDAPTKKNEQEQVKTRTTRKNPK